MNSRVYYRLSLFAAATLLAANYPVRADEEEFLELTEVRIVGYEEVKTGVGVGNVVFTAKVAGACGSRIRLEGTAGPASISGCISSPLMPRAGNTSTAYCSA
jgi:hypothetical protein